MVVDSVVVLRPEKAAMLAMVDERSSFDRRGGGICKSDIELQHVLRLPSNRVRYASWCCEACLRRASPCRMCLVTTDVYVCDAWLERTRGQSSCRSALRCKAQHSRVRRSFDSIHVSHGVVFCGQCWRRSPGDGFGLIWSRGFRRALLWRSRINLKSDLAEVLSTDRLTYRVHTSYRAIVDKRNLHHCLKNTIGDPVWTMQLANTGNKVLVELFSNLWLSGSVEVRFISLPCGGIESKLRYTQDLSLDVLDAFLPVRFIRVWPQFDFDNLRSQRVDSSLCIFWADCSQDQNAFANACNKLSVDCNRP